MRDPELKEALRAHLDETRAHVNRVELAFRAAGIEPASARSPALDGLKEHHSEQQPKEPTLADLLAATASMRVEHLELAVYDSVLALARRLGLDESVEELEPSRGDEEAALERLSRIAERLRAELPE